MMDVLVRLATEPPDLAGLPGELTDLVTSCLERSPQERPTSAAPAQPARAVRRRPRGAERASRLPDRPGHGADRRLPARPAARRPDPGRGRDRRRERGRGRRGCHVRVTHQRMPAPRGPVPSPLAGPQAHGGAAGPACRRAGPPGLPRRAGPQAAPRAPCSAWPQATGAAAALVAVGALIAVALDGGTRRFRTVRLAQPGDKQPALSHAAQLVRSAVRQAIPGSRCSSPQATGAAGFVACAARGWRPAEHGHADTGRPGHHPRPGAGRQRRRLQLHG